MNATTISLRGKPSRFSTAAAARRWADGCRASGNLAAWTVRLNTAITVTPRFGRPVTLAAGWLVCLPVDAGRLERAGLATLEVR
jgi:hypothetical protein